MKTRSILLASPGSLGTARLVAVASARSLRRPMNSTTAQTKIMTSTVRTVPVSPLATPGLPVTAP